MLSDLAYLNMIDNVEQEIIIRTNASIIISRWWHVINLINKIKSLDSSKDRGLCIAIAYNYGYDSTLVCYSVFEMIANKCEFWDTNGYNSLALHFATNLQLVNYIFGILFKCDNLEHYMFDSSFFVTPVQAIKCNFHRRVHLYGTE